MNALFGLIYLALGLSLTTTIVSRLYEYWDGFRSEQKMILSGLMVIMFAYTARGIELLWFHAPGPRPAGVLGIIGATMCLVALLRPVDPRLAPESWQSVMKQQVGPDIYDKYMDILNKSGKARNESTDHSTKYKTTYEEWGVDRPNDSL